MNQMNQMNMAGIIPEFNWENEEWYVYEERMEQYFDCNQIPYERRNAMMISFIGAEAYKVLRDLCHPELPKNKAYHELCELMRRHFNRPISIFRERSEFYNAFQYPYESVMEWYARLKQLAVECKFGNNMDQIMVDKFVTGMKPGPVFDKLCEEREHLKLTEALEMAKTKECAIGEFEHDHDHGFRSRRGQFNAYDHRFSGRQNFRDKFYNSRFFRGGSLDRHHMMDKYYNWSRRNYNNTDTLMMDQDYQRHHYFDNSNSYGRNPKYNMMTRMFPQIWRMSPYNNMTTDNYQFNSPWNMWYSQMPYDYFGSSYGYFDHPMMWYNNWNNMWRRPFMDDYMRRRMYRMYNTPGPFRFNDRFRFGQNFRQNMYNRRYPFFFQNNWMDGDQYNDFYNYDQRLYYDQPYFNNMRFGGRFFGGSRLPYQNFYNYNWDNFNYGWDNYDHMMMIMDGLNYDVYYDMMY